MGRRRTIAQRDKDFRALQLKREGVKYQHIADELGWANAGVARDAVNRALADEYHEDREEMRQIEAGRLDDMMRVLYRILSKKHYLVSQRGDLVADPLTGEPLIDPDPWLKAVVAFKGISERRSKLLGLDAPIKHEITIDQINQEIAALESTLKTYKDSQPLAIVNSVRVEDVA